MAHRTRTAFALVTALASLAATGCEVPTDLGPPGPRPGGRRDPPPPRASTPPPPRVVLLQVVGLSGPWVDRWLREGRFLSDQPAAPRDAVAEGGLARLARGAHSVVLRAVEPTLPAPNLATQLTGAPPARHGVLSDRLLRAGHRASGHGVPLGAPPIWELARLRGRRVLTWLTLGASCGAPTPPGLSAVCHPGRAGRSRPRPAQAVTLAGGGGLTLRAPAGAPGPATLRIGVRKEGSAAVRLVLPGGARLAADASPHLGPGASRAVLWGPPPGPAGTLAPDRVTWIAFTGFAPAGGRALFHDEGTTLARAAPEAFGRALGQRGLLGPAGADAASLRKGRISPRRFAETALREVEALADLAAFFGPGDRFDLAVITITTVDRLARALNAAPGRPELTAEEAGEHRRALEAALRRFDRGLGRVLASLDLRRTRVVLATTPGAAPVAADVSLRASLAAVHPRIRVIPAQGAAFVHLPPEVPVAAALARLRALRAHGREVFARGRVRAGAELAAAGQPAPPSVILAQAGPGFSLSARRRRALTGWPEAMAAAGPPAELPEMACALLVAGPGLRRRGDLGPLAMAQVAAMVAEAAVLPAPRGSASAPALFRGGPSAGPAPGGDAATGGYELERGEASAGSKPRPSTR